VEEHPTTEDFARFLQKSARPSYASRNSLVIRHLLAGCPLCHRTLHNLSGAPQLVSKLVGVSLPPRNKEGTARAPNYEWAFARAERALSYTLTHGKAAQRLPDQLAKLSSLSEGEQIRLAGEGGPVSDPLLIDCLLERSHAARYQSPRRTLHLARLAYLAAKSCQPVQAGGEAELADLQVRTLGALANAMRICGNLHEAEVAFEEARQNCTQGTGSPQIRANLLSQITSLRIFQRRLKEALGLSDEAMELCAEIENSNLKAGILVQKATALLYSGDAEAALKTLQSAIPLIDREKDPYLFLAAHHNLARCNIDLERPEEALALYYEAREFYRECNDPLILLRAVWQEGQLLREIGHLRNAEVALLRAQQGFSDQGLAYEAAMVCLDLAEVYSKLGAEDKLRQTIEEALPIFKALQIDREVLASLLRLRQGVELET
jgi:tetratricopeptide (TPR) repeat protein